MMERTRSAISISIIVIIIIIIIIIIIRLKPQFLCLCALHLQHHVHDSGHDGVQLLPQRPYLRPHHKQTVAIPYRQKTDKKARTTNGTPNDRSAWGDMNKSAAHATVTECAHAPMDQLATARRNAHE
jgi:hypothetical protein